MGLEFDFFQSFCYNYNIEIKSWKVSKTKLFFKKNESKIKGKINESWLSCNFPRKNFLVEKESKNEI